LSTSLATEPGYAQSPYDGFLPVGFKFHNLHEHGRQRIWVFHGGQEGSVRDTLVVLQKTSAQDGFPGAWGATWAAELALDKPLSDSIDKDILSRCTIVAIDGDGRFTTRAFEGTIKTEELLALGRPEAGVPGVLMEADAQGGTHLSAVARTLFLFGPRGAVHVVFAGAADGTPEGFSRIARAVDEFASAWADQFPSEKAKE
jgi:hypothetical protein